MHLERLEQIRSVLVALQRIVLELPAEGDVRHLLMREDHIAGPFHHGLRVVQRGMRHHVGHQHHRHVRLQRLIDQVQ
ncbi:hypothetical protein G6F45_014110 [Rhizopus arrhizus]|nr:hypothetical protein G6F31_019846 [Rhizopus arrhizus]KAG1605846.1 hypothetical protein G6F45_014110 [Rhizopus arrhizus]